MAAAVGQESPLRRQYFPRRTSPLPASQESSPSPPPTHSPPVRPSIGVTGETTKLVSGRVRPVWLYDVHALTNYLSPLAM